MHPSKSSQRRFGWKRIWWKIIKPSDHLVRSLPLVGKAKDKVLCSYILQELDLDPTVSILSTCKPKSLLISDGDEDADEEEMFLMAEVELERHDRHQHKAKDVASIITTYNPSSAARHQRRGCMQQTLYALTATMAILFLLIIAQRRAALNIIFNGSPQQGGGSSSLADQRSDLQQGGSHLTTTTTSHSSQAPHIILIYADDQGWGDVSHHQEEDSSVIKTPTLDRLAKEGIRLTNVYTSPTCTPSRGCLLTGLYPSHLGIQTGSIGLKSPWGLRQYVQTLPQRLKNLVPSSSSPFGSYATHMIGKWNLGHAYKELLPISRGFDTFFGFFGGAIRFFDHKIREKEEGGKEEAWTDLVYATAAAAEEEDEGSRRTTTTYAAATLQFVKDESTLSTHLFRDHSLKVIQAHNQSQSLFLYLALPNVHRPLMDLMDQEGLFTKEEKTYLSTIPSKLRRMFAMSTLLLDHAVRDVLQGLGDVGMLDNSLIVYLSDNGGCYRSGGINAPYRGTKHYTFEGGLKVPAFIWNPRLLSKELIGKEYTNLFHVSDVLPTLLDAAATAAGDLGSRSKIKESSCIEQEDAWQSVHDGKCLDGHSHWQLLSQQASATTNTSSQSPRTEALLHYDPYLRSDNVLKEVATLGEVHAAIRVGDWKLILNEWDVGTYGEDDVNDQLFLDKQPDCDVLKEGASRGSYLFNLATDPYEENNLYEEEPDKVTELMERLYLYASSNYPSTWEGVDSSSSSSSSSSSAAAAAIKTFRSVGRFVCPWLDKDTSYFWPPSTIGRDDLI